MRKGLAIAASVALLMIGGVSAQAQSDAVADQYRAYEAALARGDRNGAEAAAAAALAASEARDGEGGRTGALAANLAQLRLNQGRNADALAPAQRALRIAEGNSNAGVNPIYARLLVGQAELAANGDAGQRRLLAALTEAQSAGNLNPEGYEAAVVLGEWAVRNNRAPVARDAFERALRFPIGQTDTDNVLRARAYLGQGLALTMMEDGISHRRSTGTRLANAPDSGPSAAFQEALRLSRPLAQREASAGRMGRAQVTYGAALAWSIARGARLSEFDWIDTTNAADRTGMVVGLNGSSPGCSSMIEPDPVPAYDVAKMRDAVANAVVVRTATNAAGAIVDRRVVGAAGDQDFVTAVNAALPQWGFGSEGCAGARVVFTPVLVMVNDEQVAESFRAQGGGARQSTASLMNSTGILSAQSSGRSGWMTRQNNGLMAVVPD
jgi:tetratricopeptide (TPR) repeat protein